MNNHIYDEIIIGCGVAGLYYVYKNKPSNYVIFEKNDRIGGRVYNIEWNSEQISLGGGVIKYDNLNTLSLVKELQLEIADFTSIYHMQELSSSEYPNGPEHYKDNKIVVKSLKKTFEKNKEEINKLQLTFEQFLYKYYDYKIADIIKKNLLYYNDLNASVEYVLLEKNIEELLRTADLKLHYIKNGGYTLLIDTIISKIDNLDVKLNSVVKSIKKIDNFYELVINNNEIYKTKKIILATEKNSNIIFDSFILKKINKIYNMVESCNYIRVYTYHKNGHNLKNATRTQNIPGKIIIMSDKILMACYTEDYNARLLNNMLKKCNKNEQIDIVYSLLKNSGIIVSEPDDIIYYFWESGVHYCKPNYSFSKMKTEIKKIYTEDNIGIIGEAVASGHGWVDCALESVHNLSSTYNNKKFE